MGNELLYAVVIPLAGLGGAVRFLYELGCCALGRERPRAKAALVYGSLFAAITVAAAEPRALADPSAVAALFFAAFFLWAPATRAVATSWPPRRGGFPRASRPPA